MITKEEYERTFIRMMDSVRTTHKGDFNCDGVDCSQCLMKGVCESSKLQYRIAYAGAIVEVVEHWGKEHPFTTNADKFREVFGKEPRTGNGLYACPGICVDGSSGNDCYGCKKAFWEAEYKTPEKGAE